MRSDKRRSPYLITVALVMAATWLFAASCDSVDLSKLSVTIWPNEDGAIIGLNDVVSVEFSEDIRHEDAETATSLKSASGSVEYDVAWDGNRMTIAPTEGWRVGAAYTLRCDGTVAATDGRTFVVGETVTFFAVTSAAPPILTGNTPTNDAIVSRTTPLELTFSKPLNSFLIDRYVTTSPSCELSVTLSADGKTLTVAPRATWDGLTRYQWTVLKDLTGTDGVPIKEEYRGFFRVQEDETPPLKPSLSAVNTENTSLQTPLTAIQKRSGILFRFTEDIDPDSFGKQLAVEPDATMTIRRIDARTFLAYQSDADWVAGTEYSITIGKGLLDANGNATAEDYSWEFTAPYARLEVVSIENSLPGTNPVFEGPELTSTDPLPIRVSPATLDHDFIVVFSEEISDSETARLAEALTIKRVFPLSVSDPNIVTVNNLTGGKVKVHVIGLRTPTDTPNGERILYKLTIKGSQSGFTLDEGNILEKDFILYLESVQQ